MRPSVDFQSNDGFKQAAKKKKGGNKAPQPVKNTPPDDAKKDQAKKEGEGGDNGGDKAGGDKSGGDKSGGDKAGDSGAGGNGAGKGNDDQDKKDKKEEDAGKDNALVGDVEAVPAPKTKKKGKKGKPEDLDPDPTLKPPVKDSADTFTDIKLDDGGTGLDLNLGAEVPSKPSTGGITAALGSLWGGGWTSGGAST